MKTVTTAASPDSGMLGKAVEDYFDLEEQQPSDAVALLDLMAKQGVLSPSQAKDASISPFFNGSPGVVARIGNNLMVEVTSKGEVFTWTRKP